MFGLLGVHLSIVTKLMPRILAEAPWDPCSIQSTTQPRDYTSTTPLFPRTPTMVRYKARYLLFDILYPEEPSLSAAGSSAQTHIEFSSPSESTITASLLAGLIREGVAHQFGDWGAGVTGNLSVKYFSPQTSTGIVRVSREHYRIVWTALTLMRELKGRPIVIRVVRVSGTIKKVEKEAIRRAKLDIRRVGSATTKGKAEMLVELGDIMDDDMED